MPFEKKLSTYEQLNPPVSLSNKKTSLLSLLFHCLFGSCLSLSIASVFSFERDYSLLLLLPLTRLYIHTHNTEIEEYERYKVFIFFGLFCLLRTHNRKKKRGKKEEGRTKMLSSYLVSLLLGLAVIAGFASGSQIKLPVLAFDEGYNQLFGDNNLAIHRDGKAVHLSLDERTGSGFVSQDLYLHGFFSASIKLPADYTAGVVVAFYMSNGDMFEKNHDEIDFEFLGNIRGKDWRIQTNVYGNGSTSRGREERYSLWFDPSDDFHQYSILWTDSQIIFYVDNVPIREVKRAADMGGDFPSKPMSLYATIWDGSDWATNGGKYRVNYKYAPYVAEFSDFILHGCAVDPIEQSTKRCDDAQSLEEIHTSITNMQRSKMERFRMRQMTYSYCYDRTRYKVPPPECVIDPKEAEHLKRFDPVRFGAGRRHHGRRHHRSRQMQAQADFI